MHTELLKKNQISRLLLLVGLPLITTLILLVGVTALHVPGFSFFALAHAMTRSSTCATAKGTQQNLCEGQSPGAQGCLQDAQTVELQSVYVQNTLIGEVNLTIPAPQEFDGCLAWQTRSFPAQSPGQAR